MTQPRIVVGRHRPWLRWVLVGVVALVTLASAYTVYRLRVHPAQPLFGDPKSDVGQLREERRRLTLELRGVRQELDTLRGRSTFEARSCEIDIQACEAVRRSVTSLEHEVADLREQLTFYRNIVSPEQTRAGVRVLRLAVRPGQAADIWRYDLVLVQPVRRDRTAAGRFNFQIEGLVGQQLQTLALSDLLVGEASEQEFSFRAFQEFSGEMLLPTGFLPSRLTVTLEVQDGRSAPVPVKEAFDWSRLVAAGKE